LVVVLGSRRLLLLGLFLCLLLCLGTLALRPLAGNLSGCVLVAVLTGSDTICGRGQVLVGHVADLATDPQRARLLIPALSLTECGALALRLRDSGGLVAL